MHRRDGPRYTAKRVTGTHGKYFEVDNKTGYPVFYTESAIEHFIESEAWEVVVEPLTPQKFMDDLRLQHVRFTSPTIYSGYRDQPGFEFGMDFRVPYQDLAAFMALAEKLNQWRKL